MTEAEIASGKMLFKALNAHPVKIDNKTARSVMDNAKIAWEYQKSFVLCEDSPPVGILMAIAIGSGDMQILLFPSMDSRSKLVALGAEAAAAWAQLMAIPKANWVLQTELADRSTAF